jgi:hypothetical protein
MLEQLSYLDRKIQSMVGKLDSIYLTIEQAVELKSYRVHSEYKSK